MHLGCSSWTWVGIWDDVINPLSDVISNSVLLRSNSVFPRYNSLRVFCLGKTEFDLNKTEFEMTSLRWFMTSSQIPAHPQLLHPRCITDSQKGYNNNNYPLHRLLEASNFYSFWISFYHYLCDNWKIINKCFQALSFELSFLIFYIKKIANFIKNMQISTFNRFLLTTYNWYFTYILGVNIWIDFQFSANTS